MQIYCPKCKTGYEIEAELIPEQGRKLRCVQCKEIFVCRPEDLEEGSVLRQAEPTEESKAELKDDAKEETLVENNETSEAQPVANAEVPQPQETAEENGGEENTDEAEEVDEAEKSIKDIFQRLSVETEALFKEEAAEKPMHKFWGQAKKALGLNRSKNYKYYYLLLLVFSLLFLYYARYGIVRTMPVMLPVYESLGIKAKIIGEGLEFQNISRREFEEELINKTEIKGFIANTTTQTIQIPRIRIELLDKNAQSLQVLVKYPTIDVVSAGNKVPFSYTLNKPSMLTKYIYLTFTDSPVSE